MRFFFPLTIILSLALSVSAAPLPASKTIARIEPAAIELLDRAIAAYKVSDGIRMEFESRGGTPQEQRITTGTLQWKSPDGLRIEKKVGESSSFWFVDGKGTFYSYDGQTYNRIPLTLDKLPPGTVAGWTAFVGDGVRQILPSLLTGQNFLRDQSTGTSAPIGYRLQARVLPLRRVGSVECKGLRQTIQFATGFQRISEETTAWFDAQSHLLHRVQLISHNDGKRTVTTDQVISTNLHPVFAPETFIWSSPARATLASDSPSIPWDPKLVPGAAPYALTGRDINGKEVSLNKYRGNVVLLDFWATWCMPCVMELPNVVRNYRKYHDEGFEVIGISLDKDRKTLSDFVEAHKMPWPQMFDNKSWAGVNVASYKVGGIPFSILIGRDGKIAAVSPHGVALEESIKAALAR